MALHIDVIRGDNDHHKAEAAFKASAIAFRSAAKINGDQTPSTKGSLG
jgi:imidazoleglycerol-phosphate dehydratase